MLRDRAVIVVATYFALFFCDIHGQAPALALRLVFLKLKYEWIK